MSRAKKWAIGAFLVHAVAAASLVKLGVNSGTDVGIEAARVLSRLEFAVDPAVRVLLGPASPAIRGASDAFNVPVTSAIKAYAYPAYILFGGAFYGAIAGFLGWLVDRRSRGLQTEQGTSK